MRLHPAVLLAAVLAVAAPATAQRAYTPDELSVLNGIGGFGSTGKLDTSRDVKAPGNRLGFSLRVDWSTHGADPPYWAIRMGFPLGATAKGFDTFSCDLYVESVDGANLGIFVYEPADNRWVCFDKPLAQLPLRQWTHVEVPRSAMRLWKLAAKPEEWDRVSALGLEPNNGKAVFYIDNPRLSGPGGKSLDILSTEDDGYHAPPGWHAKPQPLPAPGGLYFPFDGARLDDAALRRSPVELNRLLGRVGTPVSGYTPGLLDNVTDLQRQGIPTVYYCAAGAGYTRYWTRRQAWDENAAGHSLNKTPGNLFGWDYQHTYAAAHPAVFEAEKQRIDALLAAGISTWMVVDYTFPWMETQWGFSETMQAAFRKDLLGQDEGLVIRDAGKEHAIHFADYFRAYHGFAPAPRDAGLASWSDYGPPKPDETGPNVAARRQLFLALRSYEWLKFPDRTGRYYRSRGGNPLWVVPNPEDSYGSSDYVFMLRSGGVGNLFPEWFGCIGWAAEAGYASLPYLREQADRAGHRLSIIHETGAGGHSAPYLDWQVAYNGIYAIAAAGKVDDLDNDFIDEAVFEQMSDAKRNAYQFNRFRDAVAKALAFRQARAEKPVRPASPILCVSERPPARATGSIFFGLDQPYSLAPALSRSHLAFDLRDSLDLERVVDRYKVIAYCPMSPRTGDLALLRKWLLAKPGRLLITHSFVPTRDAREFWGLDRSAALGSAKGGAQLGLGAVSATQATRCTVTGGADGWSKAAPHGEVVELGAALTRTRQGKALVTTDAGPLITLAKVGQSDVVYLNYAPSATDAVRKLDERVVGMLAARLGLKPTCSADRDTPVQVFGVSGGRCVLAWDAPTMAAWTFRYEPGIAPLRYEAPGVDRRILLPAPQAGQWLVYDFWADRLDRVRPTGGQIPLALRGAVTALYYTGPDTPTMRATIAAAQKTRAKMRALGFDGER